MAIKLQIYYIIIAIKDYIQNQGDKSSNTDINKNIQTYDCSGKIKCRKDYQLLLDIF